MWVFGASLALLIFPGKKRIPIGEGSGWHLETVFHNSSSAGVVQLGG